MLVCLFCTFDTVVKPGEAFDFAAAIDAAADCLEWKWIVVSEAVDQHEVVSELLVMGVNKIAQVQVTNDDFRFKDLVE